jgi:hypothetical protein
MFISCSAAGNSRKSLPGNTPVVVHAAIWRIG